MAAFPAARRNPEPLLRVHGTGGHCAALEEYDLSDKQCKALLKSPSPLADLFKDFEKRETDHMDNIRDTIECRANAVIRADFLRDRREAR